MEINSAFTKTSELYSYNAHKESANKFRADYNISENELSFIDRQLEMPHEASKQDESIMKHIYLKNENSISL